MDHERERDEGRDLKPVSDVFGRALLAWVRGDTVPEIVERDDGYTQEGAGPEVYLSTFRQWPRAERQSVRFMRGRVLDVGCGAGRVALELQGRNLEVVGLDASPFAARAARQRGVRTVWCLPLEKLGTTIGSFDSIVLFGNNFGLFGTPSKAKSTLRAWSRAAQPGTRLFLESTSAYGGGAPGFDRSYYRRNIDEGRASGQARFRYRYEGHVGSWFSWLFVSRTEMRDLMRGSGWREVRVFGTSVNEPYVAMWEKV